MRVTALGGLRRPRRGLHHHTCPYVPCGGAYSSSPSGISSYCHQRFYPATNGPTYCQHGRLKSFRNLPCGFSTANTPSRPSRWQRKVFRASTIHHPWSPSTCAPITAPAMAPMLSVSPPARKITFMAAWWSRPQCRRTSTKWSGEAGRRWGGWTAPPEGQHAQGPMGASAAPEHPEVQIVSRNVGEIDT